MSRPKRESAQRAASQTSVLFWNEERDLKKALHASLVEARRKARIAVKEKERVKEQEKHKEKESNHCDVTVPSKVKSKSHKMKKSELHSSLTTFPTTIISKENSKGCALEDNDNGINILKKARIPAQRKFAQGSSNNTPISSPLKVSYCVPTVTQEMFTKVKPTAADFLTFLCLRDTSILPERLDLEALNKDVDSEPQLDDLKEPNNFKSTFDSSNSLESTVKIEPQEVSEESDQKYSEKTLMNKIAALKVKYKLQRLAKKSASTASVKVKEAPSTSSVSSLRAEEKPFNKISDDETSKNKKLKSSLTKINVAKSNVTTTQKVLRSHHNSFEEGAFKLSLPSINCSCKSLESIPSPSKTCKKLKSSVCPVNTFRSHERKAKPTGLVDYHLEIDDGSDLEQSPRRRENKLLTKRDRESQPAKLKMIQKSNKKDVKDDSASEINSKSMLSDRVLRNRHCIVQNSSHLKPPSKSVNKCQMKCNSVTKKRTKACSSPERRPNRKAKPSAPLIDYHIEIEEESDVEMKKSVKEKEHKQKADAKTSSATKKFEALKSPSVVLTRTQMPISKQQVKTCDKEQVTAKRSAVKNKSKLVSAPEKRVTRSLSNASKKDEEAAKEREKEIKKKILEVEKRQKQRMARHPSESSLHSSSSSDSLTSISSSSSINIPRITRYLEQLKKLRKELKKNKQKY